MSTVDELYAAVASPANTDTRILLRPGTYTLDATVHPRGGTLLLQPGMELVGGNLYSDTNGDGLADTIREGTAETFIDGTFLPGDFIDRGTSGDVPRDCTGSPSSFGEGSPAAIFVRDRNRVSGLTIRTSFGVRAIGEPHPDWNPAAGMSLEVSDCLVENGTFSTPGITLGNFSCKMKGARTRLKLERNILRGWSFAVASVNGLTSQPGELERGPALEVVLDRNLFQGNYFAVHTRNTLGTDGGSVRMLSSGNVFQYDYTGIEATGGTDLGMPSGAKGNRIHLTSQGDTFLDSAMGILTTGGWRNNPFATATARNETRIEVLDATFRGDEAAIRAWSFAFLPFPGDDGNVVSLLVRNAITDGARVYVYDASPADGNVVQLPGGSDALARQGLGPVVPPPFDLTGARNALTFTPGAAGYSVAAGAAPLDEDFGAPLDFAAEPNYDYPVDDDSVEVVFPAPFTFTFQGVSYDRLFVNSDGNITFGEPDPWSNARDVARLLSGPPRISPFLDDLALNVGGAVRARLDADRVVITWDAVPTWSMNLTDENTFQVVLHASGEIDLVYGAIGMPGAVVGIAAGAFGGPIVATDLSAAAGDVTGRTIYEEFYSSGP